jgi:cell division protein FtsN
MERENIQKELFDGFDQPRRQPKRFSQLFQKTDFSISLGAEKLVFLSIGMLMLLVVSFALGVERGKAVSLARIDARPAQADIRPVRAVNVQTIPAQQIAKTAPVTVKKPIVSGAPQAVKAPAQAVPQVAADKSKPYTIVAVAFSKETSATAEVARFKSAGIEAFVYRNEPYYLVCIGAFANKESAQKTLMKVKQLRRDAYVRPK